jgi:GNAT superfamily N-acetyltransferase
LIRGSGIAMTSAMWRALLCLLLISLPVPRPAVAQEFIAVPDLISDQAFYRLVACAAPPGAACNKPLIYWPEDRRLALRVGIADTAESFRDYRFDIVDAAIDAAIAEINGAGAHLYLERVYQGDMDIPFYLVEAPQGGTITDTGVAELDGSSIAIGRVAIRSRGSEIIAATIAISQDFRRREIASVVLEELVQSLGLVTDVASPAYAFSIFAENGNSMTRLRGQDASALRRHYPRPGVPEPDNN